MLSTFSGNAAVHGNIATDFISSYSIRLIPVQTSLAEDGLGAGVATVVLADNHAGRHAVDADGSAGR